MLKRILSLSVIICFFLTTLGPYPQVHADSVLSLPAPGTMVNLSPVYDPVIMKGLTVHKDNPFLFDFIVDVGQDKISGEPLKKEGEKLIKYFLASLTIPDKDLWVNLSPYEKNRMIPEILGQTDMGRDLLEQDYILKQVTASLIYPEKELGRTFWEKIYTQAQQMYGTTQVPVNTFNKVWIMADRAQVFEYNQTVFVVDRHLKVMLEEDYLALKKHAVAHYGVAAVGAHIVRQIILPELEKEVNTGKNFSNLRQIFNSIILSSWYKRNLKEALLNQVYANQSKVKGIDLNDPTVKQQIYEQYLKAYKKGVFNYIKEDPFPRKYFSGGLSIIDTPAANPAMTSDPAALARVLPESGRLVDFVTLASTDAATGTADTAMAAHTLAKMDLSGLGDLNGKIVVVREGYDITLNGNGDLDNPNDPRIIESLPTINFLISRGAKVVLITHLGRPEAKVRKLVEEGMKDAEARMKVYKEMSLAPVAHRLSQLLEGKVKPFNPGLRTLSNVRNYVDNEMKPGEVMLLENLRFNVGEEANDPHFAQELFKGADIYVNDAPSNNHRRHASMVGAPQEILRVMGDLTARETAVLIHVRAHAKLAVIGGLKVADKIGVIRQFLREDPERRVLIGGAMGAAFLKAKGINIQNSVGAEEKDVTAAQALLEEFNLGSLERITIPYDVVAVDNFDQPTRWENINFSQGQHMPEHWTIVDIGEKTRLEYAKQIKSTTFWNGPMGAYRHPFASEGTRMMARAIALANGVVGGGDSVAAWNTDSILPFELRQRSQAKILTGGGSSLEFLEGKPLPGVAALPDAAMRVLAETLTVYQKDILDERLDRLSKEIKHFIALRDSDSLEKVQAEFYVLFVSLIGLLGEDVARSLIRELSVNLKPDPRMVGSVLIRKKADILLRTKVVHDAVRSFYESFSAVDTPPGKLIKSFNDILAEIQRTFGADIGPRPMVIRAETGGDAAMEHFDHHRAQTPGGIDLNTSSGMQWKVSKDGKGVVMNIDPAMIERVRREGLDRLAPVILRMIPISSIWLIFGIRAPVAS